MCAQKQSRGAEKQSRRLDDPVAEEERAREYLLRALTASARTRQRLAQGLAERDVEAGLADRLLDRFVELGLINDAEYGQTLVRTRFAERGLARRAIADEMRRKGFEAHDIEPALEQISAEAEEAAARELVRGRLRRIDSLARDVQYRRLAGFLGRKGYSSGLAMRVIKEELAAHSRDKE